ncbi:YbaK/EbsC family protein [Shimwellia pseudoproteus]|uniref:YbaK/EbsC family protein n=1 Tax=Shimwellia pseudoproteus TaxID=570012 RepID=UPI0018EB9743|nr:YbaK/EbsC family protein [Shimwellia pseudoproteus]MBJ3813555.1 YbaK/EbsC family protein [Shimwellia pseudoproteus]
MSLQSVRQYFADNAPDIDIIELKQPAATLSGAAEALHVAPGQIAKTLSLKVENDVILIVARGDVRLDNEKLKQTFKARARMLSSDEVLIWTGHPATGVCPFGLENPLPVYCDISLRDFPEVVPAAGAVHSAVRISPERLAELTAAKWVDVCQR